MAEVLRLPKGFKASSLEVGVRYEGRLDVGLIASDPPAAAAACFTENAIKAAPVRIGIERFLEKMGQVELSALIVNSGNANACTGRQGLESTQLILDALSGALGVSGDQVLMSSTGVIGEPLPYEKIIRAIPGLVDGLSEEGLLGVAQAILTTDTREKVVSRKIAMERGEATMVGIAKGAGMIAPKMAAPHATMLAFILTDASVEHETLQKLLSMAVDASFNRITVDGDTSTNDTVFLLANGASGTAPLNMASGPDLERFKEALFGVSKELARMIVRDGEGATKVVEIVVRGGWSLEEVRDCAVAIANSPLVKTAFFGEDPNWGRIVAAAGKTGHPLIEEALTLWIDDVLLVTNGEFQGKDQEARAHEVMKRDEFTVTLEIGTGDYQYSMLTTDLTKDYVSINADYRS